MTPLVSQGAALDACVRKSTPSKSGDKREERTQSEYTYDVCSNGVSERTEVFLTFVDASRIPAITNMTLYVDVDERAELEKRYSILWKDRFGVEVKELKNTFKTACVLWDAKERGFRCRPTYGFKISLGGLEAMIIPESNEAPRLLRIARYERLMPILFKQPEISFIPRKLTHRDVLDGFFVDVTTRNRYAKNVIPRRYISLLDVKLHPQNFKDNPYADYASSI
ncbi:MAG: hypothetical protein QW628_11215 [Thermofilum sp.]